MNTGAYIKIWRYLLFAMWLVCVASSAGGEVRAIVKRVQIEGARSVSARDVRGWLVTRAGVAVDSALLRKDVDRILKGYQARGFWHVTVAFPGLQCAGAMRQWLLRLSKVCERGLRLWRFAVI